jgi:hypothetical protein
VRALKLVQVGVYFDELGAIQAKNWLETEGVTAGVEGGNVNTALSHVGSALSGVRLLVAEQDYARARELLVRYGEKNSLRTSWYCGECQETNEPSFDLCWSCGKVREEVDAPFPAAEAEPVVASDFTEIRVADIPAKIESNNPYQPPLISEPAIPSRLDRPLDGLTEQMEQTIQRAWRASVIGFFIPIIPVPVLQFYSIWLLLGIDLEVPISQKAKRQFRWAWSLNIFLILLICLVIHAIVI